MGLNQQDKSKMLYLKSLLTHSKELYIIFLLLITKGYLWISIKL